MSEIGTYGSTIYPPTPFNVLPEPGDAISWDWMDSIAQFSQRYLKMATVIATVTSGGTYLFDYSSLRCDIHPPYLLAYYFQDSQWKRWVDYEYGVDPPNAKFIEFLNIGIGTAQFHPVTGTTQAWLFSAYL